MECYGGYGMVGHNGANGVMVSWCHGCSSQPGGSQWLQAPHRGPYHTIPYRTILYHTVPWQTIPHHNTPHHTTPHYTTAYTWVAALE